MTFLGKIFSMLILVLSLCFLMLSVMVTATHKNWKDVATNPNTGLKTQVEAKERGNKQLQESVQTLQVDLSQERAARRAALAAAQTQRDQFEGALQDSESEVQKLTSQNTILVQEIQTKLDELARLDKENTELRDQIAKEREDRDELFLTATRVTDELNSTKGMLSEMEERNETLLSQNTRYKEVLQAADINPADPIDGTAPRRNGVVLVVNQPRRLVQVSIGYDDGLRESDILEVTRGPRYLGKLRVRKLEPNQSVAEILPDLQNGVIKEGDRVDTTIK